MSKQTKKSYYLNNSLITIEQKLNHYRKTKEDNKIRSHSGELKVEFTAAIK